MSEITSNGNEASEKKAARCTITDLRYDVATQTIDFKAALVGNIQAGRANDPGGIKWQIEDAKTSVVGAKVPVRDMIVRVMVGWFWVRKIQDLLRKGSISDARAALNAGWDWNEATSKGATKAAPAVVGARVVAAMDSADQLAELIAKATARMAELAAIETADKGKND